MIEKLNELQQELLTQKDTALKEPEYTQSILIAAQDVYQGIIAVLSAIDAESLLVAHKDNSRLLKMKTVRPLKRTKFEYTQFGSKWEYCELLVIDSFSVI